MRKCLILGFCSILKFDKTNQILNQNKNLKVKLLKIFCEFIIFHKDEQIKKGNKLMKDELKIKKNEDGKYLFGEESESEDEKDEEEERENNLNKNLNWILETNENIKNSDEYKFFKDILDLIKLNDAECINILNKEIEPEKIKQLEEVYHTKKFKFIYQGEELEIPRRILSIRRNNN